MRRACWLPILLLILSTPALTAEDGTITAEKAWARENPPVVPNGAAYMTLVNKGTAPDRLLGVSGDVAKRIELHTHLLEGSVMKMRPVREPIAIGPGETKVLQPGGLHVMLIDLKQPLAAGQTFPLTLHFERAGDIPVEITVQKIQ